MSSSGKASREALEVEIRRLWDASDLEGATTVAIRGFGPEILGFIAAIHRNEADAAEVFSQFCEEVWKSIASFSWRSSFRTWAYTLARRTSFHFLRGPVRRQRAQVPLSECSQVQRAEEQVRSRTAIFLRTETKRGVSRLRERLAPEDRLLLILRVDKQLAWNEVAEVMLEEEEPSPDVIKRESARLRKRFELVKAKILEMGKEEGLLGEG